MSADRRQMLHELVGHWHKRGPEGLRAYDPDALDTDLFDRLMLENAGALDVQPGIGKLMQQAFATSDVVNDFAAAGIREDSDITRQIETQCFFGCEADDPMTRLAFDPSNPGGAKLGVLFSSDIGHWDVPQMNQVLAEAHELVDKGLLDRDQFRSFSFENAVRCYACLDPGFFEGTRVEAEAARVLTAAQSSGEGR